MTRPPETRVADVVLVFVGGMLGTLARYGALLAVPPWGAVPGATIGINVVGAFLLGWLVEAVGRRGESPRSRAVRLFAGTGVLGGFTTYSALAVDTDGLLIMGEVASGLLYAGATVLLGAAASVAGILVGTATGRRAS